MKPQVSFIERQFPVSKVSKESYKERKSSQGQTITGLGKWWGRKPLILVRAAILGCLLPATDNPKKDREIFLKLLSMDERGLWERKHLSFPTQYLYDAISQNSKLRKYASQWFTTKNEKIVMAEGVSREEVEHLVFAQLGYDAKIAMCIRPEQLENLDDQTWAEINEYLGTSAHTLPELVQQLAQKRFGHKLLVGDCFCGGGSIPFEAARIGCNTYASDLNPIASLLTWGDVHICGANDKERQAIIEFQQKCYNEVDKEIRQLGIEENEQGDRALSYIYCLETDCPECGYRVPLLPTLVVGIRAGKVIAELKEQDRKFAILIKAGVSATELKQAQNSGTIVNNELICPHCGKRTPISAIRHDMVGKDGEVIYGLRLWGEQEFEFRPEDVYHERLYAIRYEHLEYLPNGKMKSTRYYCAPSQKDLENEKVVHDLVAKNLGRWQKQGMIPKTEIKDGIETARLFRERGWTYWHQLFSPRQLFLLSRFAEKILTESDQLLKVVGILGLNKCADFGADLCRWNPNCDKTEQTFYNQAFNTIMNWGVRSLKMLSTLWFRIPDQYQVNASTLIRLKDARAVDNICDFWITDPPYADAVNYHELSEFFLAWDKELIKGAFPDWYTDSKRVLAVRGDEHFSQIMIEIYTNLVKHMPADGMQIVMFTHSDPAIWAQLAVIMWKSGLRVTAAWNIATETDASGLKNGNYVKGTVLLVLRKQVSTETAFLDELNADIRKEVKNQITSMLELDDKEDPNFSDPDYVLAAYAASLKVLTSYAEIEDLNLDFELNQAISNPGKSQIVTIIENAKKIAYDCVIPLDFDSFLWKELSSAEKFYIKGLENEKHGNYQISTYQEFARGFSISGYAQLMASERANTACLKTPVDMAGRSLNEVPDFEASLMRTIFMGIYVGVKEDNNPQKALGFIKNDLADYWGKREMILEILHFLIDTKDISNMQEHWQASAAMAEELATLVQHDTI